MKKLLFLACTLLVLACRGDDIAGSGGGSEYLNVSNVEIPGGNITATLNIQASNNCEWVISWSESWIRSITPSRGRGTQNATVTVSINPSSTKERVAIVTVKNLDGTIERLVTITQLANTEQLTISPQEKINFSANGGSQEVTITSNTQWTITGKPNWMIVSKTEGDDNGNVTIIVEPNVDTEKREAVLIFKGSQISQELKVIQAAASYYVNLTNPQVTNITPNGASVSFTYESNTVVNSYGICYATIENPTIENAKYIIQNGNDSQKNPTLQLADLIPEMKYYVRAFARMQSQADVKYSESISFTTTGNMPNNDDNKTPNPSVQ